MIIELVGLPGAGKTTLAQELAVRGAVTVGAPGKFNLVLDVLAFECTYPGVALRLATTTVLRAPRGMRYSLYVNGYLVSASKFMQARRLAKKGITAVIDQGHAQLVVSLQGLSSHLLTALPKPDVLALIEAIREVREARMHERGRTPREETGDAKAFDLAAEEALTEALPSFKRYPRFLRGTAQKVLEELPAVFVRTPFRTAPLTKQALLALASFLALPFQRPRAAVLMYHAVDTSGWKLSLPPADFARQMEYLVHKHTPVPLADIVAHAKGEKTLPAGAVAVTFDDGYHDLVTTVLPVIEQLHIPITVFLTTKLDEKTTSFDLPRITTEDIEQLRANPLVSIESHGRTHPHLPRLTAEEVTAELVGAKDDLERLGITPAYFAYPFGDRNPEVEAAVCAQGYVAAFSISEGFVRPGDDVLHLKRIQLDATQTFSMFRARLTHALTINRTIVDFFRRS